MDHGDIENEVLERPPVGNLTDFAEGVDADNPLEIEVAIDHVGKILVFHNKKFTKDIAWFEFDLQTNKLDFIMDDGEIRDAGLPLQEKVAKHMQNSHQIHMILYNEATKEVTKGNYVPLILHGQ